MARIEDEETTRDIMATVAMAALIVRGEHTKNIPEIAFTLVEAMVKRAKEKS